jgi:hypothetical protein
MNKEERQAYNRAWKLANRDSVKQKVRLARDEQKAFVRMQKTGKVCATCGESDTTKLLFHHVDKATKCFKLGNNSDLHTKQTILEEIAKCVLLCRSCHARLHNKARHNYQVS